MMMTHKQILQEILRNADRLNITTDKENAKRCNAAADFLLNEVQFLEGGDITSAIDWFIKGEIPNLPEHFGRFSAEWLYKVISYYMPRKPKEETPKERQIETPGAPRNEEDFNKMMHEGLAVARRYYHKNGWLRPGFAYLFGWMRDQLMIVPSEEDKKTMLTKAKANVVAGISKDDAISQFLKDTELKHVDMDMIKLEAKNIMMCRYFEEELKKERV